MSTDLALDEITLDEVRWALRQYFAANPGVAEVRRCRDGELADGFDAAQWQVAADQLDLVRLCAPVGWGGLGLDLSYAASVVEECGASLYPGPARAAVVLAVLLRTADPEAVDPAFGQLVERVLAGTAVVGLPAARTSRRPGYADGAVSGSIPAVSHGATADVVVCVSDTADGGVVTLIDLSAAECARTAVESIDMVVPFADLEVTGAPAIVIAGASPQVLLMCSRVLAAAEQVGGAQGCLTGMVEQAKIREQFDRPIGTYQAIQHRCADLVVRLTAARALVDAATKVALRDGYDAAAASVGLAAAEASDAFDAAAESLIQVCGGIGFTWEHDAHLYFRHARTMAGIDATAGRLRDEAVVAGCADLLLFEGNVS